MEDSLNSQLRHIFYSKFQEVLLFMIAPFWSTYSAGVYKEITVVAYRSIYFGIWDPKRMLLWIVNFLGSYILLLFEVWGLSELNYCVSMLIMECMGIVAHYYNIILFIQSFQKISMLLSTLVYRGVILKIKVPGSSSVQFILRNLYKSRLEAILIVT